MLQRIGHESGGPARREKGRLPMRTAIVGYTKTLRCGLAWTGLVLLCSSVSPATALAQTTGIAGVVKDTTGAVLPGVSVEASSPALIEKVRDVVTDGQGQYKILDLRPGTYAVTFSLSGFNTVRREGIELNAAFTATVNADLRVGSLAETITVAGQAPTVDIQNVLQQKVMTRETIDAVPTGSRSFSNLAILIPGTSNGSDVGGTLARNNAVTIHDTRPTEPGRLPAEQESQSRPQPCSRDARPVQCVQRQSGPQPEQHLWHGVAASTVHPAGAPGQVRRPD